MSKGGLTPFEKFELMDDDLCDFLVAKKSGCYIATCVYGGCDAPETMALRRFRDGVLKKSFFGRLFIRAYYAVSPALVRVFGEKEWFRRFWRGVLDRFVLVLRRREDRKADARR